MLSLIVRRLIQLPLVLLAIYTLTLALSWAIPGSPLDRGDGTRRKPDPVVLKAMEDRYQLNSFWGFYTSYLGRATGAVWVYDHWLTGRAAADVREAQAAGLEPPARPVFDLGPSLSEKNWQVNDIIAGSLPVSVGLGATAILIALVLGLGAGIIGAVKPNSVADILTLAVALVGISLPSFVIGTALLLLFPVLLGIGSVGSWGRPGDLVLPAFTLSLPFAAYIARLTRMGMLDVLGADFIRTARAKGVPESRVLLRHALKNAFLPVLSYLGPAAALAMTGSFVVERVFSVPGMGQHFVDAVTNKDHALLTGVVLVFSVMLIVFNLLVDVLYRWVDPRIE